MSAQAARVGQVTFADLAAVAAGLYVEDKTLFVFDLDDTIFSARSNDDDVEPEDYVGFGLPGAAEPRFFEDTVAGMQGFYVSDMAKLLQRLPVSAWTILTAGDATTKDMDGNRVAIMLGRASWSPRRITGVKTARVRSTAKLREVAKLAKLFPKREIVYFDDQPTAFRDAASMPDNVQMFRVVARDDDDDDED